MIASGSQDRTLRRWVAAPEDWYRLSCARLAHHPLLRDPASQRAQRSAPGPGQALASLLAWARGLLGG